MAVIAGHRCAVKVSGTAVAMSGEACTSLSSTVYQVTNAAHRILDPATAVEVVDNGSGLTDAQVSVDYLFGKVTRVGGTFTGPVTVTGAYLPTLAIGYGQALSLAASRKELEVTAFGDDDREWALGLKDASGEIQLLDELTTDMDPGAGTETFESYFASATPKLLEVTINPDTPRYFRAWVLFPELGVDVNFDELIKSRVKWRASARQGSTDGASELAGFGWGL